MSLSRLPKKNMPARPKTSQTVTDTVFKRFITIFTAVSIAAMYGWLGGFESQPDGNVNFHWRWGVLMWALVGVFSTIYFWGKVWPPEGHANATSKDVIKGTIVFAIPGLWWLAFPLRNHSGRHFWDVMSGLIVVFLVLTFGACMIFRLVKTFEATDEFDLQNLKAEEKSSDPESGTNGGS